MGEAPTSGQRRRREDDGAGPTPAQRGNGVMQWWRPDDGPARGQLEAATGRAGEEVGAAAMMTQAS
jgi:hypothetical protein